MPRNNNNEPQMIESSGHILDDEEIDEDEAFNSEDELMYGNFFSSSKSKPSKKKSASSSDKPKIKKLGKDSDDESSEEEDDSSSGEDSDDGSESDGSDEHDWAGSDDDSEEEDDGGQYMLDLLNNLDKQVPSSGKNSEKKKEGKEGKISLNSIASEAAVHLKESEYQSGALSAMNNSGDGKLTLDSLMGGISDTAGFASVQKSMRALSSGTLQSGKGEAGDLGGNQKLETTQAPVSRVVSERASRKVHYQSTSQDVTNWQDAVNEQRDAETLDFRTNKGGATTHRVTRDTLVEKFEASTDFEKEMQDALEKAGVEDEKEIAKREKRRLTGEKDGADGDVGDGDNDGFGDSDDEGDDDLGRNKISMAEYKKRHGELAKLRALMFYEEQKRHRINKIKSKKYRKIRKRQKDRLKDAEDEAAKLDDVDGMLERERIEQEEMDRMKERMTLAHKNTSKWARRVLRRGKNVDVEERRALSLQIAKGEELRRKVMGVDDDGGDSGSEEETEEDLLRKARDILMENNEDENDEETNKSKKKGLFQLEFMKRGMEAQRSRAKEEARKLLEELESNEMAAFSSDSEEEDDYDKQEKQSKTKKPKVATEEETSKVLPEGKLVASSLQFGKGDGFAIKVDGDIELDECKKSETQQSKENDTDDGDDDAQQAEGVEEGGKKKKKRRKKKNKQQGDTSHDTNENKNVNQPQKKTATAPVTEEEEENPWIVSKSTTSKKKKPLSRTINIDKAASMLVDTDTTTSTQGSDKNAKRKRDGDDNDAQRTTTTPGEKVSVVSEAEADAEANNDDKKEVGVAELSQAELVRRAFASPADLEAEEEFKKEKDRMSQRDDPTRKKKEDKWVSGWGSWAGAGAPPPKKPRKLPPKKLRAPPKKQVESNAPKRKDDGKSTVIINEKRLKKTAAYQLSEIPYPYRSREEYEKAIAGNIGQEWNTINGTKEMSRPAVMVRAGKIIQPIGMKAKRKVQRAPAKF